MKSEGTKGLTRLCQPLRLLSLAESRAGLRFGRLARRVGRERLPGLAERGLRGLGRPRRSLRHGGSSLTGVKQITRPRPPGLGRVEATEPLESRSPSKDTPAPICYVLEKFFSA